MAELLVNGRALKVPEFAPKMNYNHVPDLQLNKGQKLMLDEQDVASQKADWVMKVLSNNHTMIYDLNQTLGPISKSHRRLVELADALKPFAFMKSKVGRWMAIFLMVVFFGVLYPIFLKEIGMLKAADFINIIP